MSGPARAELIARAAARLTAAGVPDAMRDARLLCRWAAGLDGAQLAARLGDPAGAAEAARFERAVAARERRVPVSHIIGAREFWGRSFRVTPAVLDPRPETEILVAKALEGPPARRILDLGTGTGCILLTLVAEWPDATGVGTDISPEALEVARANAEALGVAARTRLALGDWCDGLEGPFDLAVSNPPYISEGEMAGLEPEVRMHEPAAALTPGGDGLDAYRRIAAGIAPLLAPGGRLMVEIGAGQAEAVMAILAAGGLGESVLFRDLDGRERVVLAYGEKKIGA